MLTLTREAGESLVIGDLIFTVIKLLNRNSIAIQWRPVHAERIEPSHKHVFFVQIDQTARYAGDIEVMPVEIRDGKVRLVVSAPKHVMVHRFEVYEAIVRQNRSDTGDGGKDADDGLAGSRVPRPPTPRPPSLVVRLDEPPPAAGL